VHVIVAVPVHAHPGPDAEVATSPDGIGSVIVVVLPSVGLPLTFWTVRAKLLPTCPEAKVSGLWLAEIFRG
jgi:hypothetical protein